MAPPILLLLLLNRSRKKWASVQWRAVTGSQYITTFTDCTIQMHLMVWWECKILGVFLNRNHIKHTHCSCTTQSYSSSAEKYRGERFCRIHILHLKTSPLSWICLSIPRVTLYSCDANVCVYCAYAKSSVIDEKGNWDKTAYSLSHKLCVLQRQSWLLAKRKVK